MGALSGLLRRAGRRLGELQLVDIPVCTGRVGRFFHFVTTSLQHISIDEPLDAWHLDQLAVHFPRLRSLSVYPAVFIIK
jgi:hypothetical protein